MVFENSLLFHNAVTVQSPAKRVAASNKSVRALVKPKVFYKAIATTALDTSNQYDVLNTMDIGEEEEAVENFAKSDSVPVDTSSQARATKRALALACAKEARMKQIQEKAVKRPPPIVLANNQGSEVANTLKSSDANYLIKNLADGTKISSGIR